jgi:hypothetical protein
MKEEIRPIYAELWGYFLSLPKEEANKSTINDPNIWEQLNKTIDELSTISGNDYNKFKIESKKIDQFGKILQSVNILDYKQKLNGLISKVHTQFFFDESSPFSDNSPPNLQVNQSQNQEQNVEIKIALEIQSLIDEKLNQKGEQISEKEKTFLEKVKESLKDIKNVTDPIKTILTIGSSIGLTVEQILKLLFE